MKKLAQHKFAKFIMILSILILLFGSGYLIYMISKLNNIENNLRLYGSIVLGVICLILIVLSIHSFNKFKKGKLTVLIILMFLIGGMAIFAGLNVDKVYASLAKVSDTSGYTTYSSSLVTLKNSKAKAIGDIGSSTIGILSDTSSYEGSIIPKEVFKSKNISNKTKEYDSYIAMIDALLKGQINYIFLPTNYSVMFGSMDGYTDIKDKTKIIYTQTKKVKKEKTSSSKATKITEPFTILLMGVDSETEGISGSTFNGDSLMLITFNPKTLSTTIVSIPRDSYVPIACFTNQRKNKITHAAWKGEECMINTIQNFLDVKIDYYVKINFKGVVKLVDTLGGVDINVPYNLCEQNSSRQWGANTIYITKGQQTLNGEQALAYSRNRHPNPGMCSSKWTNYTSNDFIRGEHQQEVVTALLNKFKSVKNLNTVYKLLDTISNNMTTNMSTDQILSLYNIFKDVSAKSNGMSDMSEALSIQKLHLNGYDARIFDYGGTNLSLYDYVLYDASVKAVSNAMKENLGLKKTTTVKSFSFDVNTPYVETVIGKDITGKKTLVQLPSFIGKTVSYARSFCSQNGISVTVNGGNGYVLKQSVPSGTNVEDIKSIVLTAGGSTSSDNSSSKSSSAESATVKTDETTSES
jgi:LCP family protein required for cell wall assembly